MMACLEGEWIWPEEWERILHASCFVFFATHNTPLLYKKQRARRTSHHGAEYDHRGLKKGRIGVPAH